MHISFHQDVISQIEIVSLFYQDHKHKMNLYIAYPAQSLFH